MWARAMEVGREARVNFEKASLHLWFEDPLHRPVSAGLSTVQASNCGLEHADL